MKKLDPKRYNLSSRTNILQGNQKELYIVIDRKSRIIMKDGYRILNTAKTILETGGPCLIHVLTSAPVCSKTQLFLLENNIQIKAL